MRRATLKSIVAHRRRLLATCSAVVLSVAFLAGTLVLNATLNAGFSQTVARANAGIDALVRSDVEVGVGDSTQRRPVDRSLAETIAAVDGVDAVAPRVEGDGRIVGADGDPVGGSGPSIAGNWVRDEQLNPYEMAAGRAPAAPGEVVIDKASAEEGELAIGDRTVVRTPGPVDVTIVGLATFGGADRQGATTYAGFTERFADRVLLHKRGRATGIAVAADPQLGQGELAARLEAALDDGIEALTGAELTREMQHEIHGGDLDAIRQALLTFAFISLVVALFSIYNTFSILVAQRTREWALLRALGASRRQVLRAVAAEALAVGLVGSMAGIVAGAGLAAGLLALMDALGRSAPASAPVVDAGTVSTAIAVGTIVTLVASLAPAVRASRIAPLAALRDAAVDHSAMSQRRAVAGVLATAAGVAATVVGVLAETPVAGGLGALATLIGLVTLGPVLARPLAGMIGAPLARRAMSGVLARRNAVRNPRRTAGTAMSLIIGVAVVSLFTVLAASFQRSIEESVQKQFAGELVVIGEGRGGLSGGLASAVDALPEVAAASPIGGAPVRIDGRDTLAITIDPATIGSVVDLDVRRGSLSHLARDGLTVSVDYAAKHGLALGDSVSLEYADGADERRSVGAIYANDDVGLTTGVALPRAAVLPHAIGPIDVNLLIDLANGVTEAQGEAAVQRVADRFEAPDVQTNHEFTDSVAAEINVVLTVVYALLIIAIVIAIMGIATTLSLSVHERTRELGLLRAVGQTRRQTRAMVRGEALIVSLFGTVGGLCLGVFLGWAAVSAVAIDGFGSSFVLPVLPLVVTVALGALAGLLAAAGPARRAARLDVLDAVATE